MLLKVLGMWALVSFELALGLGVWLAVSVFVIWSSKLANWSLVLLLHWGFDYERVEKLGLLVVRLVVGASFQLELLFTKTILGLEIKKTV